MFRQQIFWFFAVPHYQLYSSCTFDVQQSGATGRCKGPSIKDVSPNFHFLGYPPSPCLPTSPLPLSPQGRHLPIFLPPSPSTLICGYFNLSLHVDFCNAFHSIKILMIQLYLELTDFVDKRLKKQFYVFVMNSEVNIFSRLGNFLSEFKGEKKTSPLLQRGSLPPSPNISY